VPNSFSYRDPDTGEWAHNLSANIDDDVCNTYIDPIWDKLLAKAASVAVIIVQKSLSAALSIKA